MNYKKINNHMKNKFSNYDQIVELDNLPNEEELQSMSDNIVYKVPMVTVAVDIVDFKKMNEHSDAEDVALVMSEFTYGVTSIMKDYGAKYIEIQGDGIFCNMPAAFKPEIDDAFSLACALNVFKKHIIKSGKNYGIEIKNSNNNMYSYNWYSDSNDTFVFNFGIAFVASRNNHITKVGKGSARDLIFLGRSVNTANALAKESARNNYPEIMFDDYTYANLTDDLKDKVAASRIWSGNKNINGRYEKIYGLNNWISTGYNNFVINNVGGENE